MSIRTIVILVLALVSGLSAAAGVNSLRQPAVAESPETVSIVVAAQDIARFTTITADMVTTRAYPKDFVLSGALTSFEEALGRVAFSPILKEEPVLNGKLAAKGQGKGMAAGIPDGMRACTIPMATVSSGVAGFILPGNKVDVLLTVSSNGGKEDPTGGGSTTPLLRSVEILSVGQRLDAPVENKINFNEMREVTLLVTERQALMLALAKEKGILHLSLRNPNDRTPAANAVVTMNDIRNLQGIPVDAPPSKPVVAEAPPPQPLQIRTLRGNQESVILIYTAPNASQKR